MGLESESLASGKVWELVRRLVVGEAGGGPGPGLRRSVAEMTEKEESA